MVVEPLRAMRVMVLADDCRDTTESAALLLKLDGRDVATANSMHQLGKYSSR